jgi:hypothetical protein
LNRPIPMADPLVAFLEGRRDSAADTCAVQITEVTDMVARAGAAGVTGILGA